VSQRFDLLLLKADFVVQISQVAVQDLDFRVLVPNCREGLYQLGENGMAPGAGKGSWNGNREDGRFNWSRANLRNFLRAFGNHHELKSADLRLLLLMGFALPLADWVASGAGNQLRLLSVHEGWEVTRNGRNRE